MTKYAFYEQEIDSIGVTNIAPVDTDYVEIGDHIDPNDLYIKDGLIKVRSTCPDEYYSFDIASESWIDNSPNIIDKIKASALIHICDISSKIRSLYVTDIRGQEVVYTMKRDEALRFLSDNEPDIASYPLIAAEIGITAATAYEVAQVYINMSHMFVSALAMLENVRLTAVVAIENATTRAEVENALNALNLSVSQFV